MALHEVTFPSTNHRDTIQGWIYAPARPPRAIVQIVHGLGEHCGRYLHLISALVDAGFVVTADDHAGHGRDPLNALTNPMSLRFVRDFANLYDAVNEGWAQTVSTDLPVLIVAGDQDPVANYGEGAYHVANSLWPSGNKNVRTKVFSGFRHEVHNEPPIRAEVEAEVISFIENWL